MTILQHALSPLRGTELFSLYQPIVDGSGTPVGFEALLRGVQGGVDVDAGTLFATATAGGTERLLDRRAAELAVHGANGWLGERLLFVNLAPVSFLSAATWLDALLRHLDDTALVPGQIVVELNEKQHSADLPHLRRLLADAREVGLQIALDDVLGDHLTDFWSANLSPDFLKIDGSVVRRLNDVGGILPLERVLRAADRAGATVIAEQVETLAQRDLLRICGVDLVQGWLTGEPSRADIPAQRVPEHARTPSTECA